MIKLCLLSDLSEGASKGFDVDGRKLFAVMKYGKITLYENHCPHLGIQLEWMPDQFLDRDKSLIQCAMHGALFRIEDGLCISGPCIDRSLVSVPFELREQAIWLTD